jgi:hypothetical protein
LAVAAATRAGRKSCGEYQGRYQTLHQASLKKEFQDYTMTSISMDIALQQ